MSRQKQNLTRLPTIDIPYRSAFAKYGVQVAKSTITTNAGLQ